MGATGQTVELADGPEAVAAAVAAAGHFDAFVFGAPVYRAAPAWPMKAFLDALPRGFWAETEAPITGRAVAITLTGATDHHHLALDGLRNVLAGFFAAQVLSPGLYFPASAFAEGSLVSGQLELAQAHGRALVELAAGIAGSKDLSAVRPQV